MHIWYTLPLYIYHTFRGQRTVQTLSHSMKRKRKISQHHDQMTLSRCGPLIDSVLTHTEREYKMKSFFLSSFLDHSILVQSLVIILYDTCACGSVYI